MKTLIQLLLLAGLSVAATGCKGASKTETSGNQVSDSVQMTIPSTAAVQAGSDIQTTKPFKGVWSCEEPGELAENGLTLGQYYFCIDIDFYEKTVMYDEKRTHGFHHISTDKHCENSEISSFKIDGNKATIEYVDGSGGLYNATLIYNPADKSMEFIDGKVIKESECSNAISGEQHLAMDRTLQFQKE